MNFDTMQILPRPSLILLCAALLAPMGSHAGTTPPPTNRDQIRKDVATPSMKSSLVRVNSTNQNYQLLRPWTKRSPYNRRGTGVVLTGNRILVTAELVANANFVELENPETQDRSPAKVQLVDYEANLAILAPADPTFLDSMTPVRIADHLAVGDSVEVTQMEPTGSLARTPGTITTISQGSYPADGTSLVTYSVSVPLQYRDNSFNLPVFAGDQLAGLLMRYDARTQTAELVPAPVIQAFLHRTKHSPYQSFSRLGILLASNRDPKFRRYLEMQPDQSGIYVSGVTTGSPADIAGLKNGDVILSIDGQVLDDDGNYEHPMYGKISFAHHIATERFPGDEVAIDILRDGEKQSLKATLAPRDPQKMVSEPFLIDRAPSYVVLGGIVMQELSRAVLKEWGGEWQKNAPQRLVYLDEFQDELPADRGKVIFISQILPSDASLGYEDVGMVVVESINDRPIRSLQDVTEAAKHPINGFHYIRIDADPRLLILDAKEVDTGAEELKRNYNLPALEQM